MDLWFMIKERYMLLSIFYNYYICELVFTFSYLEKRSDMPKSLTVIITIICTIIIVLSIFALVFAVSFGYNS